MRKYETEIGVSLVVVPQVVGRQRELESADITRDPPCHLYLVTETPRVSIPPSSVNISGNIITGTARRQVEDSYDTCEFKLKCNAEGDLRWESRYPYEDFSIVDCSDDSVILSTSAHELVAQGSAELDEWCEHNILYIGQAFGHAGERQAFDRLRSHSTLQRIYSEQRPDREIWLSLCAITDVAVISSINPRVSGLVTGEEDMEHFRKVHDSMKDQKFYRKEGVALAEAGLIKLFAPKYNIIFKDNFPDPKHVALAECLHLDLHTLVVEFQGVYTPFSYRTDSKPHEPVHFAEYPLFVQDGRLTLLDFR
ncbi:hypothetical protein [Nocardia nova]|uniref:hypothetical protein n=1 Tax=Nocardia nova TaxID=37330 RepID=UPI0033F6ECC6